VFLVQLTLGSLILVVTTAFHIAALVMLSNFLKRIEGAQGFRLNAVGVFLLLGVAVLAVLAIHTIEAWSWAAIYFQLGEFTELKEALYFSVVTATTLGYGDVILSERWRLLGTFEAMGGLILFGVSTAFLIELMRRFFEEDSE